MSGVPFLDIPSGVPHIQVRSLVALTFIQHLVQAAIALGPHPAEKGTASFQNPRAVSRDLTVPLSASLVLDPPACHF